MLVISRLLATFKDIPLSLLFLISVKNIRVVQKKTYHGPIVSESQKLLSYLGSKLTYKNFVSLYLCSYLKFGSMYRVVKWLYNLNFTKSGLISNKSLQLLL